jgi:hypothetical protein
MTGNQSVLIANLKLVGVGAKHPPYGMRLAGRRPRNRSVEDLLLQYSALLAQW